MASGESHFDRSLESGGELCFGAFSKSLASVSVAMFPHSIYFLSKYNKFRTFNEFCIDNAAIYCSYYCSKQENIISVNITLY
jgi:hypothetical protein